MVRRPLPLATCTLLLAFGWVTAAFAEWSYADNPLPIWSVLPSEEQDMLLDGEETCEAAFQRHKALYRLRFPGAPALERGSEEERRFMYHLVHRPGRDGGASGIACMLGRRLRDEAESYRERTGRRVCSLTMPDIENRPHLRDYLRIARAAVVGDDRYYPLFLNGMGGRHGGEAYSLNKDIRAFLGARYDILAGTPFDENPASDDPPPERLAFVRKAALRGDLDAVLETTAPCE